MRQSFGSHAFVGSALIALALVILFGTDTAVAVLLGAGLIGLTPALAARHRTAWSAVPGAFASTTLAFYGRCVFFPGLANPPAEVYDLDFYGACYSATLVGALWGAAFALGKGRPTLTVVAVLASVASVTALFCCPIAELALPWFAVLLTVLWGAALAPGRGRLVLTALFSSTASVAALVGIGLLFRWLFPPRICVLEVWAALTILAAPLVVGVGTWLPVDRAIRRAEAGAARKEGAGL